MMKLLLVFLTPLLLAASCKKTIEDELSKLPPATQTGANTFGCLVNGKAWLPDNGCTLLCPPSLKFYYYTDNGGELSISADNKINTDEYIGIGIDSLLYNRKYSSNINKERFGINYSNRNIVGDCRRFLPNDPTVSSVGVISITRFDIIAGIISGTFEFTLSKPGCETINITHGRFDAKL